MRLINEQLTKRPPDPRDRMFRVGAMSEASAVMLDQLSCTAPIELYRAPFAFLEDPGESTLTYKDLTAKGEDTGVGGSKVDDTVQIQIETGRTVFHLQNNRAEFCIICHNLTEPGLFKPYFILTVDPSRSSRARNYMVSIVNSLVSQKAVFEFEPVYVPVSSMYGSLYNPLVQKDHGGF